MSKLEIEVENISVSIECPKICWIVDKNDLEGFSKIIDAAHEIYGGIYSIIVPVHNNKVDELSTHLIKNFDPDYYVSLNPMDEDLISVLKEIRVPLEFVESNKSGFFYTLQEVYARPGSRNQNRQIQRIDKDTIHPSYYEFFKSVFLVESLEQIYKRYNIDVGQPYSDEIDALRDYAPMKIFGPHIRRSLSVGGYGKYLPPTLKPLDDQLSHVTKLKKYGEIRVPFVLSSAVYIVIGSSKSVQDMSIYWSLRTMTHPAKVLWVPADIIDDDEALSKYISRIMKNTSVSKSFLHWQVISLFASTLETKKYRTFEKSLREGCKKYWKDNFTIYYNFIDSVQVEKHKFIIKDYPTDVIFKKSIGHVQASPPEFIDFGRGHRPIIANLSFMLIHLPVAAEVTEKVCLFPRDKEKRRTSTTGIRVRMSHNVRLRSPDESEVVIATFKAKGYDVKLSDKGIIARNLIDLMGGLEKCRLLREKRVIDLVTKMNKNKIMTLKEIRKILRSPESLEKLIACKILFRGYSLRCSNCCNMNWFALDKLKDEVHCGDCRSNLVLPLDLHVEYKINALVIHAFNQGALTHIVVLSRLRQYNPFRFYMPGLIVNGINRELDLAIVAAEGIAIGECKNDPSKIQGSDIDAILHIANTIKSKETIFGTLSGSFSKKMREKGGSSAVFVDDSSQSHDMNIL